MRIVANEAAGQTLEQAERSQSRQISVDTLLGMTFDTGAGTVDQVQRGHFYNAAQNRYLELKDNQFQAWVIDVLRRGYPRTFVPVRLTQGDGKIDGYFVDGRVVACYAPRESNLTVRGTINKMNSDFAGAKAFLNSNNTTLNGWTFVYNDRAGLAKEVIAHLAVMAKSNPDVSFEVWGFEAIWVEIQQLRVEDLEQMFGPAPTVRTLDRLTFQDILPVIEFVSRENPPPLPEPNPPDVTKLEGNNLSPENQGFLRVGRSRAALVEQYFDSCFQPEMPEEIAESFRSRYQSLKRNGLSPDRIFNSLWEYAGGEHFRGSENKAAVLAVLSHFFSSCDIFENVGE